MIILKEKNIKILAKSIENIKNIIKESKKLKSKTTNDVIILNIINDKLKF